MPKIMAFATLDGTSFWVKNAIKKKHLLAFKTLNKNALTTTYFDCCVVKIAFRIGEQCGLKFETALFINAKNYGICNP